MQIIKCARGRITGHFGDTGVPGAHVPAHLGMDIGHGDMTAADLRVGAPAAGVVTAAGRGGTYGNRLIINHGRDAQGILWESLLGHLAKFTTVVGEKLATDAVCAVMGNTGGDWPVHLHQELRRNGVPVDPEEYLSGSSGGGVIPINPQRGITMAEAIVQVPNSTVCHFISPGTLINFASAAEYTTYRSKIAFLAARGGTDALVPPELADVVGVDWATYKLLGKHFGVPAKVLG